MRKLLWLVAFVTLVIMAAGCARAPLVRPEDALTLTRASSSPALAALRDDLSRESLIQAVKTNIAFLESPQASRHPGFLFGERRLTREEYVSALKVFLTLSETLTDPDEFAEGVKRGFDFYQVYGQERPSEVFITSYYEPVIEGSLKATTKFSQPIYRTPDDLVLVDLGAFDPKFLQERKYRGRLENRKLLPYYSREEIDNKAALKGRKLELCWVDPIDAFFLHIQGSATVHLDNGTSMRLNYAEKNGHRYESLGKFMSPIPIPKEELNLHTIEAHLRKLSKPELDRYFNLNPSYVFFEPKQDSALTYFGVPATDGRTIATDPKFFSKGALAFLAFEKPVFDSPEQLLPSRLEPTSRFVLDQDIGGAITGGGRVDLFWGRGAEAKHYAGAMKNKGSLYYLAAKMVKQ